MEAQPTSGRRILSHLHNLVQAFFLKLVPSAALLFLSSGRLDWLMAWIYVAIYCVTLALGTCVVALDSGLAAERAQIKENAKAWDRSIACAVSLSSPASMLLVAGLDARFRWSPEIPFSLQVAALVISALGSLLTAWAMASNKFFSRVVRIQKDRGHEVATGGPYRYIRHPGYAGAITFDLATPLALGSLWAMVPAGLVLLLKVVRTGLEDTTLQSELDGYREYAKRVRYRLLPGVW